MEAERQSGPAVICEGVSLRAGEARLVRDVSLRVPPGTIHCLVGPNGAGKTSLLRCVLGLAEHDGAVRWEWPGAAGTIGYVPQTLDFDRSLPITAEDFLMMCGPARAAFLKAKTAARSETEAALAAVGLTAKRRTPLGKLSGGELKRLLVAQALAPRPALLVLDEPMNHLDPPGVETATELLRALRREGRTVICSLHDLAHARALADTVTMMQGGRVLFSGAPSEVLTAERIVQAFAGGVSP